MQGIKLVTFDATNTLLKFKVPPWEYYGMVGREFGFVGEVGILKEQMNNSFKIMSAKHPNFGKNGISWENWWKEIVKLTFRGQLPLHADIDTIANKLINEFRTTRCWTVADNSHRLLEVLKQNDVTVGVISNFDPRLVDILHNVSLYNMFDFVLTSYDTGYSKPDKQIFNKAIETCETSMKPSECLHVGDDSLKDYTGAKAAGWYALLVTSQIKIRSYWQPPPGHVFNSVSDLCLAVERNNIQL